MKKWALLFLSLASFFAVAANSVLPPTGLKIVNPFSGVGDKTNPVIRVMGVQRGDWVRIYTDSNCRNQVGEAQARYQLVHITTSPLAPGDYLFYVKIVRRGVASVCSVKSARYKLVTVSDRQTLSFSMQDPNASMSTDTTPILRIKGASEGDLVRLYTDAGCTQMVGSQVVSGAMTDLAVSRPLPPGDYSFYADVVGTKRPMDCFDSKINYTVSPIVIDQFNNYFASNNGLETFEKNRLWAEQVAENPWGQLMINVVVGPTPMSFLAAMPEERTEAARALAFNEHGLVDLIPLEEPGATILQEGVFVETPPFHEWQRKTFSPLEGQFQAQIVEVGKYSARIRFPLIPETDWYSIEKTNLKTMTDESFLILIYPPVSESGTHIEYLLVGLRPAWEYTIQISAMARGVFFLDVDRAHTSVRFKTGGNPISSR